MQQMRLRALPVSIAALLLCLPFALNAHHGFTPHYYPDRVIRIDGTVKRFDFINPHGLLLIDSVNESGEPVEYVCELQARTQLIRHGADASLFTVGEHIVVIGFAARRDPYGCEFGTAYFDDGSSFTMRTTDKARSQFAENRPAPLAPGVNRSIFGTWIRAGMYGDASGAGPYTGADSITAAGRAAVAAYDPVTDRPVIRCEADSPANNWRPPGLATSIHREGDEIVIFQEHMDVTRTVHLDLDEHPANVQPSRMGHSIGSFQDGVLLVDTVAISGKVIAGSMLHTEQLRLEERISVEQSTGRLLVEWTAYEPVYYSEPLTGSQRLQSTDKKILPYNCVPGTHSE